ncbi:J domain-containing protein [Corallococcus sp. AS-1-6]|uniref:J domain-containing protein n=1 Tax=Corallococcus sp. AS-1-6 TaxID=2874599 RepID=UPI001CBEDD3A|nr:J domain-containing protein [Corallococcus sp. AS-1-6]MBZ4371620.1 J domain-containing protein [Corallococcus sp. AS-1-6]
MADLYAVLGVAMTADAHDIRCAYLRQVRRYHPDSDPRPESTEHFLRIQAAYDELGDAARRQRYDARKRAEASPAPAPRCELNIPRGRMSVKVRMH